MARTATHLAKEWNACLCSVVPAMITRNEKLIQKIDLRSTGLSGDRRTAGEVTGLYTCGFPLSTERHLSFNKSFAAEESVILFSIIPTQLTTEIRTV